MNSFLMELYITEAIFNVMCFWWYGSCREDFGIVGEDCLIWDIAHVKGSSVYNSSLVAFGLAYLREEMMENSPLKWFNSGRISSALNFLPEDVTYLESEYGMLERTCFSTWMFRTVFRENSLMFLKLRISSFLYSIVPTPSYHKHNPRQQCVQYKYQK